MPPTKRWAPTGQQREICGTTDKTVKRAVEKARAAEAAGSGRGGRRPQLRPGDRHHRRAGGEDRGPDHGQASAARRSGPPATRGRPATCAGRWPRPRRPGASTTTGDAGPACGHRATCWCSTGGRSVPCSCSARCWPGAGSASSTSPTTSRAETTMAALAQCMETIGGVPKTLLTDRMGCLKGATVAGLVVPTPDYVRFVTHYGTRPDFCQGADPESKGIVENLVGYVKSDLMIPEELSRRRPRRCQRQGRGLVRRSERSGALRDPWQSPPNGWSIERALLGDLPSLRARIGKVVVAQGRPPELCPVRLGPLLGADGPHRSPGRAGGGQRHGDRRLLGRDHRHATTSSPLVRRLSATTTTAGPRPNPTRAVRAKTAGREGVLSPSVRWPRRSSRGRLPAA